jgi:hypothetical protein
MVKKKKKKDNKRDQNWSCPRNCVKARVLKLPNLFEDFKKICWNMY